MSLEITQEDLNNIEAAKAAGGDIWNHQLVSTFKDKVKTYYREIQNEQCCYCRKNFEGEFKMVIDIEHILPKGTFENLMFTDYNLNVACKRCNMNVKGVKTDFVTDLNAVKANPQDRTLYKIIHPNFDDYFSHLKFLTVIENQYKLIKYQIVIDSAKGQFTYDYFRLKELEVDTLNQAQGLKEKEELSSKIPDNVAKRINDNLEKL